MSTFAELKNKRKENIMKTTLKIENFKKMNSEKMRLITGGSEDGPIIVYIDGKPYKITKTGLEPL